MSDDHDPHETDEDLGTGAAGSAESDLADESGSHGSDEPDDLDVDGTPSQQPSAPKEFSWSQALRNMSIVGRLVVHHVRRDVVLFVDGDSALRAIEYFARRQGSGDLDSLTSKNSSAEAGWVAIDLTDVIGLSWLPGIAADGEDNSLVFDPVAPAA